MNLNLSQSAIRFIMIASLTIVGLASCVDDGQAQLLKQVRTDYGVDNQIQYAPDDPSTRSRLFTLQTGHAGAFYNCDGEECKRNSPYICWKTAHGDRVHRTFWDVLQWGQDRDTIAQRICDGGCCGSKTPKARPAKACGCSSCASKRAGETMLAKAAPQNSTGTVASNKLSQSPNRNVAGLVSPNAARLRVAPKPKIASSGAQSVLTKVAECDCLACRKKREAVAANKGAGAASPRVNQSAALPTRSASLLDRARSSRTR